jgi:radical SAM protein (TIGR01212 family)
MAAMMESLYRDYSSYLRQLFGCRVQKISLDAGLTCPNRDGMAGSGGCIYCNIRGSGTGAAGLRQSITEQLERGKSFLGKRYKAKKFIAYFQSFSNTYAPLDKLRALYQEALAVRDIVGLSIGTRPDCVPEETLDYLGDLSRKHFLWLEYGLQSGNDATLERINRGHGVRAFEDAVRRTNAREIPVCAHVILGLPGEGRREMLETARYIASQDVQGIKIHLLYVIRGTVLHEWHRKGMYRCLSREEYVGLVGEFLSLLPPHIIVHRLTGDPHPGELVAPQWALEKRANLNAIHDHLRGRGLYQGKEYRLPPKDVEKLPVSGRVDSNRGLS